MMMQSISHIREVAQAKVDQLQSWMRSPVYALITVQGVVLLMDRDVQPSMHPLDAPSKGHEAHFTAVVAMLILLLQQKDVHGRRLHVYVSDYWARPLTLQLAGNLLKEEEIDLVLMAQFRRRYAESMEGWSWCWAQQGLQLSAVAWPLPGLNTLRQGLEEQKCILAQATPLSVEVSKQFLKSNQPGWFAMVEETSVSLVRQREEGWESWLVIPANSAVTERLSVQLQREVARRGDDCRRITLIKVSGTADMSLCRKGLIAAGWTVDMAAPKSTAAGHGFHLSQMLAVSTGR